MQLGRFRLGGPSRKLRYAVLYRRARATMLNLLRTLLGFRQRPLIGDLSLLSIYVMTQPSLMLIRVSRIGVHGCGPYCTVTKAPSESELSGIGWWASFPH
jgi:hypothetical protein